MAAQASAMSRKYNSSVRIDAPRGADAGLEAVLGDQVHAATELVLEAMLQPDQVEHADPPVGRELDQEIDIAGGTEVVAQRGAEERELADAEVAGDASERLLRNSESIEFVAHRRGRLSSTS
jgi:hypothetical protein